MHRVLVRKPEGRYYLEDLGIDGRIILKMILRKSCCMLWTGFMWLRIGLSSRLL
jgi:hypothetical protein